MKRNFFKVAAMAAVFAMVATSCSDDNANDGDVVVNPDDQELEENQYYAITEAQLPGIEFEATGVSADAPTWAAASWAAETDKYTQDEVDALLADAQEMPEPAAEVTLDGTYKLEKSFIVAEGQKLTIKPGTVIVANGDEIVYIMICQGATIDAQGTEVDPIIMTASNKKHGAWGGLHICGKAAANNGGGSSEIGDQPYGGSVDTDNSGVMKFIRIEFAGQKLDPETEANGFTFYGVGSGTVVENCCAYKGADDGYEWFGGKVTCANLVSIDNQDDSFDWTYGFTGTIDGAYAKHLSEDCDHLMEGDSNKNDGSLTPISHPVFSDVTLVGVDNGSSNRAIRLRRASRITIENGNVSGKTNSFDIISAEGTEYFIANKDAFTNVKASGKLVNTDTDYAVVK